MRCGPNGYEMSEDCFAAGVAAITYDGVGEVDFSAVPLASAKTIWRRLGPAQKSSLNHLVYDMRAGDTIFVKRGPQIAAKGIIRGKKGERAYRFNSTPEALFDPYENPWFQQVPVAWSNDFTPLRITVGTNPMFTIQKLSDADAQRIEGNLLHAASDSPPPLVPDDGDLSTESYLRAGAAYMRIITPRHNKLSNDFSDWLKRTFSVTTVRERQQVDVRFSVKSTSVLAELKICLGLGTRHAIREALGQLLEYNFYPVRIPTDVWLIVLDCTVSDSDRSYVDLLRKKLSLPLHVGWREKKGFSFHPPWP